MSVVAQSGQLRGVCCVEVLVKLSQTMRECWSATPGARLTMLRVKKTLSQLKQQHSLSTAAGAATDHETVDHDKLLL